MGNNWVGRKVADGFKWIWDELKRLFQKQTVVRQGIPYRSTLKPLPNSDYTPKLEEIKCIYTITNDAPTSDTSVSSLLTHFRGRKLPPEQLNELENALQGKSVANQEILVNKELHPLFFLEISGHAWVRSYQMKTQRTRVKYRVKIMEKGDSIEIIETMPFTMTLFAKAKAIEFMKLLKNIGKKMIDPSFWNGIKFYIGGTVLLVVVVYYIYQRVNEWRQKRLERIQPEK
ncbi:hypothetical protein FGO68_gene1758 [Halteria grandinella]|uniref:Uncharacterized protein n=1 Tax=Halteria grandinella TaxID=5974 RepID=A0A8J8NIY1_HALGN|nr:hypothetical protein FGO68_gene1758 [Halteria grandinella]